jgi:3-hydroxyisobutyrate dehydrogenase-like beta-hydroxyacid dehydrogenase
MPATQPGENIMATTVAFIGLGNMGNPMALNMIKKGFALTVYDVNAKTMENLVAAGAKGAKNAAEAVAQADVVFTSLPGSPEVLSCRRRRSGDGENGRDTGRLEQRAAVNAAQD